MKRLNVDHAHALRAGQTEAERKLWRHLRDRRLLGWKFRRQHEIGSYVVDFVCADAWLVLELDGGQHLEQVARDAHRTAWLQREGYRVLRFWNDDVLKSTDGVLEQIVAALDITSPHPSPLPAGEREQEKRERTSPHPDPLPARERATGFAPSPLRGEGWGEGT